MKKLMMEIVYCAMYILGLLIAFLSFVSFMTAFAYYGVDPSPVNVFLYFMASCLGMFLAVTLFSVTDDFVYNTGGRK